MVLLGVLQEAEPGLTRNNVLPGVTDGRVYIVKRDHHREMVIVFRETIPFIVKLAAVEAVIRTDAERGCTLPDPFFISDMIPS